MGELVMAKVKRTERGWAAHFIMADKCGFRRNTLLESPTDSVIISTVGAMFINGQPKEIGLDRHYETMVFKAKMDGPYLDIDVAEEIMFDSPGAINHITPDVDNKANDMHEAVVAEFERKMKKGRL